jgi:hypothetical protein
MKKIPLRNKKKMVIAYTLVDDGDFETLNRWRWHCTNPNKQGNAYAARQDGLLMHRVILMDLEEGQLVDHIDGDGFNNQRNNLRVATQAQNSFNRRNQITNKFVSQFKGVTLANSRC